jgi:hypothetical protein
MNTFAGSPDLFHESGGNQLTQIEGCGSLGDGECFLIFRISDPSMDFQKIDNLSLAVIQVVSGYYFLRQPIPPERGHELTGTFFEVGCRETGLAASFYH